MRIHEQLPSEVGKSPLGSMKRMIVEVTDVNQNVAGGGVLQSAAWNLPQCDAPRSKGRQELLAQEGVTLFAMPNSTRSLHSPRRKATSAHCETVFLRAHCSHHDFTHPTSNFVLNCNPHARGNDIAIGRICSIIG